MSTQRTFPRDGQRGMAIIAVALFALISIAYVSATLTSSVAVQKQNRYFTASQRAHDIAESAVHRFVARLGTPGGATIVANGVEVDTITGADGLSTRYSLTVWSGAADGIDNDLDGVADDSDESDILEVRSTGYYDQVARTVRVTLTSRYRPTTVGSATYISNPFSTLNFSGVAFRINGFNHDINGALVSGSVPGIGVPSNASSIAAQIPSNVAGNITGAGGSPSVLAVATIDIQALIEEGARSANMTLGAGTHTAKNGWGTISAPTIVYAPQDIKLSGGGGGVGILLVDGVLEISGGFEWRGLIVVRGEVRFVGGGGGKRLVGAMIVEEDPNGGGSGTIMDMRGTIDVLFSQDAVDHVMQAFATYTILNWREGPNPVVP